MADLTITTTGPSPSPMTVHMTAPTWWADVFVDPFVDTFDAPGQTRGTISGPRS